MRRVTEQPGVYAIVNRVNGKRYVGSASNISKRWSRHRLDLRAGKHPNAHLQAAWRQYGEEFFDFVLLLICPAEVRIEFEQRALDTWRTCDPAKGYNREPVAGVTRGMAGRSHPADVRAKIAESNRRAKPRDEPGSVCPKGHIKDGTYRKANGRIRCQECERIASRERARRARKGVMPDGKP